MNLLTKEKQTHSHRKQIYGYPSVRGVNQESEIKIYTPLYLKWITNKDLLYSTGNSAQYYVAAWMGEGFGENGYMYTYG